VGPGEFTRTFFLLRAQRGAFFHKMPLMLPLTNKKSLSIITFVKMKRFNFYPAVVGSEHYTRSHHFA